MVITNAHWPNGVSAATEKSIITPPINPKTKDPVRSSRSPELEKLQKEIRRYLIL